MNGDRLFLVMLYRWFPSILKAITIIRPETLVRWHRAGFRRYWRWKSRSLGGRPQVDADLRALIRRMSIDNPLWGAPRIHGELLKFGFEVADGCRRRWRAELFPQYRHLILPAPPLWAWSWGRSGWSLCANSCLMPSLLRCLLIRTFRWPRPRCAMCRPAHALSG